MNALLRKPRQFQKNYRPEMQRRSKTTQRCFSMLIALTAITAGNTFAAEQNSAANADSGGPVISVKLDTKTDRKAVAIYAQKYGVSLNRAKADLVTQLQLNTWATSLRQRDSNYAGFRLERKSGRLRGVVALVNGRKYSPARSVSAHYRGVAASAAERNYEIIPRGLPIRVVNARINEKGARRLNKVVTDRLRTSSPDVAATTYDPFDDRVTIWLRKRADGISSAETVLANNRSAISRELESVLGPRLAGAQITFKNAERGQLFYGGMTALNDQQGACTTGFGVTTWSRGERLRGYITAGHCRLRGGNRWEVHSPGGPHRVTNFFGTIVGGYLDRTVFVANGSHWLTRTGRDNIFSDLNSNTVHLSAGSFFCNYGQTTNQLYCDTIVSDNNVQEVDENLFNFFWLAGPRVICNRGDSGGPVWMPGNGGTPGGMIMGGKTDTRTGKNIPGTCVFLSLDDNLRGWSLL